MKLPAAGSVLILALTASAPLTANEVPRGKQERTPEGTGYTMDWFTVDAGGGRSSGGGFNVEGTFGQPDAGDASGSGFALRGGFWPGELPDPLFKNGFE